MNPKEHIEDIQNDRKDLSDRNLRLVTGSISTIKKAFPSESHFLMEFIQNADDAHSTSIKIEVYQDVIKIFNNGDTFSTKDVEGICGIGQSSKSAEYMGYLGVGFKSVFLMSDCPQIYSGGYRFEFDKNHWENPENTPWQVMPVWIDKELDIQNGGWNTIFVIPKAKEIDEKTIRKLEEETSPEHLNNRIILFLRYIKEIEIHDKIKDIERKIVKFEDISGSNTNYEIYSVEEYENDESKVQDRWLGCIT